MRIRNIKLINFRSYSSLLINFNSDIILLHGNNAQGKTNLVESIVLASTFRSHRSSKDNDLIKFGESGAYVLIDFEENDILYSIEIYLPYNKKKRIKFNRNPVLKISDVIGKLKVIIFSPEDLKIVKEGPSLRRRFLNMGLSQCDSQYFKMLSKYNKIMEQRNYIIKSKKDRSDILAELAGWDNQLAGCGVFIFNKRKEYLDKLNAIAKDIHKNISGNLESITIQYLSCIQSKTEDIDQDMYLNQLRSNIDQDIRRGTTTFGIHREDFNILINDISARDFCSQGQQRTAALSLKLSEIKLIQGELHQTPILILDDVFSELDRNRREYIMSHISGIQTIITDTNVSDYNSCKKVQKFLVKESVIT